MLSSMFQVLAVVLARIQRKGEYSTTSHLTKLLGSKGPSGFVLQKMIALYKIKTVLTNRAKIAQSVEHPHGKGEVPGSIPGLGSSFVRIIVGRSSSVGRAAVS
jgi:hypothetical protein